jgi:hypothetical protein
MDANQKAGEEARDRRKHAITCRHMGSYGEWLIVEQLDDLSHSTTLTSDVDRKHLYCGR